MELREPVAWFAEQMETVLRANDHKVGWDRCAISYLRRRLNDEVGELHRRLEHDPSPEIPQTVAEADRMRIESLENVIKEAADVANFAMMLADRARRQLPAEPSAPR